jgi:hypothetical protein
MTRADHATGVKALIAHGWSDTEAMEGMNALAAMDDRPGGTSLTEIKATIFMGVATEGDSFKSSLAEFSNPVARRTIAALITIELSQ